MPTEVRRVPSYRLHKPTGQAVVRLDGHDYYLGKYGTPASHTAYQRRIAEWTVAGAVPPAERPGTTISLNELFLAFWRHAQVYYRRPDGSPSSELEAFHRSLEPAKDLYGETPVGEFGPLKLKAVRKTMIDRGLSRRLINQRVGRIVRAFKWGVEAELVPPNVHHGLKAVRGLVRGRTTARETLPIKPADDAVVDVLEPFLSRQVWTMIELQRLTGMRPGEVCQLRTADVDTSGPVWVFTPASHKTEHHGKDRPIYIGPRAQAVLRPWFRPDPLAYLFQPREAMDANRADRRSRRKTKLTPSLQTRRRKRKPDRAPGDRYTTRSYYHAIIRAIERAHPHPVLSAVPHRKRTPEQRAAIREWHSAQHWHPHQLRHNAATNIRREFGLDVARIILGHTSPTTTEIYAEADREKALAAVSLIG